MSLMLVLLAINNAARFIVQFPAYDLLSWMLVRVMLETPR